MRAAPGCWLAAGLGLALLAACAPVTPQAAVEAYVRAVYAHDYAAAYAELSALDQAVVTPDAYAAQHDPFGGAQLEAARRLASLIEFQDPQVTEAGDTATVAVRVRAPDGNAPAVAAILDRAGQPGADAASLLAEIDALLRAGQLAYVEGDQSFELSRSGGRWGVDLRLREAALVSFTAGVQAGLPWEFEALQASAWLKPGELVYARYRVKNLGAESLTGKAAEATLPAGLADHVHFLQCFCLLQLSLDPGEEQILTVAVVLSQPLPESQRQIEVRYDFYPLDAFPETGAAGNRPPAP